MSKGNEPKTPEDCLYYILEKLNETEAAITCSSIKILLLNAEFEAYKRGMTEAKELALKALDRVSHRKEK